MEKYDRRCVVYADIESARDALDDAHCDAVQFGTKLVAFAKGLGRVLSAQIYGDVDAESIRELKRVGCGVTLTSDDGDGSAAESIAMAMDAAASLILVPQTDVAVIVTDDAQLGELVRRLRQQGRFVVAIVPAALLDAEPARTADRPLSIEELLSGSADAELPLAVVPRAVRPRPTAVPAAAIDFENYDWSRLVILLRDLEAKMPFVGMRWLKNKVIGPHNVGVHSMSDKQNLLNRAVDNGLVETYRVGNRDEEGDPVTACRLLRDSDRVKEILEANPGAPAVAQLAVEAS